MQLKALLDLLFKIYQVFVHSPEDLPNANSHIVLEPLSYDTKYTLSIQPIEVENAINIREESIEKRQCRFPDERFPENASLSYSFAACLIYRRVALELELCNCTIHTSPIECM